MPRHYSDPKIPATKGGVQNRGVGLYIDQGRPFKNPGGRKAQQARKIGPVQKTVPKSYSRG